MPWSQTSPMDQRTQFIADYLREVWSVTELCEAYGVSRKTGHKWIDRYLRQGPVGLEERPRRPNTSPHRTPDEIQHALLEARRRHPSWGAKKLLALLNKRHPRWELPHRSTVCEILSRNGMVPKKPRRRRIGHPGKPGSAILAPNDVWSADFKGQFKTGNGGIRWNNDWVNVSTVCIGEYVGLEEIDNGIWSVYFGPLKIGRLDERHMRIEDQYGLLKRYNV